MNRIVQLLVLAFGSLLAANAGATSYSSSEAPVSPVEGVLQGVAETIPQQAIGRLIEDVCPGTLTTGNEFNLDPNSDLKQRCDEMWANALIGNDIPGVTTGLQATADEEDTAIGTGEVDAKSDGVTKIQGRMASVRSGSASGVSVTLNGVGPNLGDSFPALGAGDGMNSKWGGFLAGTYAYTDRDKTDREVGFTSDTWGATGGIDYRWTENLLIGGAFTYLDSNADLAANSGQLDSETWGGYAYGTYYPDNGVYIDYTIGYAETSHDQKRNVFYTISQINVAPALAGVGPPVPLPTVTTVTQVASSDTDSNEFSVSATLGRDWQSDNITFGPYLGISYADVEIDGFRESMSNPTGAGSGLALYVDDQDFKSLITRLGGTMTFTFEGPWGPIYPYVTGEYVHEFKNNNDPVTGGFIDDPNRLKFSSPTDPPDRNFANLGAGVTATLGESSYFYTRYTGLVGYKDLNVSAVEFGFLLGF